MLLFSNAKINLGLRVIEKRPDKYHNIETIMVPVGLSDLLEFTEQSHRKIDFINTGIQVNCTESENLVIKAYHLLKKDFQIPGIKIHLHKFIPPGAGLGGGSSNAAFMLKGLNDYFKLELEPSGLEHYAGMLGSDCPVFIKNKPCLAEGKGEKLSPVTLPAGLFMMLLYPGFPVSTLDAYQGIIPGKETPPLPDIMAMDPLCWKDILHNHFEDTIFSRYPAIREIKNALYNQGALFASMTGSGSSVYGLFSSKPSLSKELTEIKIWEGEISG